MDDLSGLMRGLGDATGGGEGGVGGGDPTAGMSGLIGAEGGLDGLLGKLRDAGLGDQVDSWIGTGPNQSIDAAQLQAALGDAEIQRLSGQGGSDIGALLPLLAAFLPQLVDMLTPNGHVPDGGLDGALGSGGPGGLGGLLGSLGGLGGLAGGSGGGALDGIDDIGDLLGG